MADFFKLYKPEELEGLNEQDKKKLQEEFDKQIDEEVRAIIDLYNDMNKRLKGKLNNTLNQLKNK